MKRSALLITAATFVAYLSLTSYSTGPAAGTPSLGNRTGTGGIPANCSGSTCHGTIDPNIFVYFTFTEIGVGTVTNNIYKPGKHYTVNFNPKYPGMASYKFGFQLTVVRTPSNLDVGNTIIEPTDTHIRTVNNITVLEHSKVIGLSGQVNITFNWTAPPPGSGKVTFHLVANAVNNNGVADPDDHAIVQSWQLNEGAAAVDELSEGIKITAYPNPATDHLNLRFVDATTGQYIIDVIDITGATLYSDKVSVDRQELIMTIPGFSWTPGLYFVKIRNGSSQRMLAVSKQ